VLDLIGALIDSELDNEAVALSRKLEQFQRRRGERKTFVGQMQEISAKHRASTHVLEFLSELFNSSNKESEYAQTLLKLFDLYFSLSNFEKAGECLDRAAEVDPYEPGHQKRLESLKGKIDDNRYQVIASRFNSATKAEETRARSEEVTLGTGALQDLMLQAEILVQYGMKSKAVERLLRIQELFPHEEDRNEDLQRLYMAAGVTPKYAGATPVMPVTTPPVPVTAAAPVQPATYPESSDVSSLTKVADITRKLYKQSTANNVLAMAVNEIGSHWRLTRCVAAMRKPGLPPTAVQEYTADGVRPSDPSLMVRLISILHELTITRGPLAIPDTLTAPELQPVREIITELALTSLLALPLGDGQEQVGILLLMQTTARGWNASDIVVLKTIGEQITIALNNVGLRRLVKNLSVTDEGSGLLNRASYLDLLQAEIRRALQQATPVSVLLMKFSRSAMKDGGENALESTMQAIGKMIAANIRQNDLAFRYDKTTVALVLGETSEKEALMALEKLRKLIGEIKAPGKDQPVPFAAGLGQAVTRQQYDPVDIVTEIINRAEQALDSALTGSNKVVALAANAAAAAVA
jgi:diguanylate cyclase (GGDEF)-like protein